MCVNCIITRCVFLSSPGECSSTYARSDVKRPAQQDNSLFTSAKALYRIVQDVYADEAVLSRPLRMLSSVPGAWM